MDWVFLVLGVIALPTGLVLVAFYGIPWGWIFVVLGVGWISAPFFMRAD